MPTCALTSEVGPSHSTASPAPTYSTCQLAVIFNKAVEEQMEKLVWKNGKWKARMATALLERVDEIEEQVANWPPAIIYKDEETHSEALNMAQEVELKADEVLHLIKEMKSTKKEEEEFKASVDTALDDKMWEMALDIKNSWEEYCWGIRGLKAAVGELWKKQELTLTLIQGFKNYLELLTGDSRSGMALLEGRASAVEVADKGVQASKADKAEEMEEMEEMEEEKERKRRMVERVQKAQLHFPK
jgi:hypothetical protein